MTQFQPLPEVTDLAAPHVHDAPSDTCAPPPFSIAAVSGFVLSLLGFLGVTAALGLILGIVGISSTRGGRRRGRGLAIAALPISLVTGACAVAAGWLLLLLVGVGVAIAKLPPVLGADASDKAAAAAMLRGLASEDFSQRVTPEALETWIGTIASAHGRLVEVPGTKGMHSAGNRVAVELDGRFVNGRAGIRLTFVLYGYTDLRIDDIEVDGSSPRRME